MPGFDQVLRAVVDAWQNRREAAVAQAAEMTAHLQGIGEDASGAGFQPAQKLTLDLLKSAEQKLQRAFDWTHGGFGTAPKFPHSMDLQVLLRTWQRWPREESLKMVTLTLDKMASGGIYDHLAGGFARYSVDERWLVPHFEKMLYDNALLLTAYLETYTATREERFATVARESVDYILKYMTDADGGFHSTEDADSEGEEGKFYVWTPAEIEAVLGKERAEIFCYVYDVTPEGNFEHGKSILNLPKTISQCAKVKGLELTKLEQDLSQMRQELLAVRDQRIRPGKDDKILVSWNALMIDALARAGVILSQPEYLAAAEKAAGFILTKMSREDGRLLHTYRHGEAKLDAYLDDYAYLVNSLVTLYETSHGEKWIDEAVHLADILLSRFADTERGGFYFTADDHEQLIARNKDLHDSSVPSGNAMAATALLRLGKLCGRNDYLSAAEGALFAGLSIMERSPTAAGQLLIALDMYLGPTPEIVIVGLDNEESRAALSDLQQQFIPRRVLGRGKPGQQHSQHLAPLFAGRTSAGEQPSVFICENFACQAPVSGLAAIREEWDKLSNSPSPSGRGSG
jgi:uncharacterized protein YyaL (SSP411 family)